MAGLQFLHIVSALLAGLVFSSVLAVALRHRDVSGSRQVAALMAVLLGYVLSRMLVHGWDHPDAHRLFFSLFWGFGVWVGLAVLAVVLQTFGWGAWPARRLLLLLGSVPFASDVILLVRPEWFTVPTNFRLVDGFVIWDRIDGPWFPVANAVLYGPLLVALVLLAAKALRAGRSERLIIGCLILGLAPIMAAGLVSMRFGPSLWRVVVLDLCAIPLALAFAVAVFRFRLLSLPPLASRLLNSLGDPLLVVDANHRVLFVNDACCALVGSRRDTLLGSDARVTLPPQVVGFLDEGLASLPDAGTLESREVAMTDAGGSPRAMLVSTLRYSHWRPASAIVCVMRDITVRRQSEEMLRQSEHRLRMAQEGAHVGVWEWDVGTNEAYWSPQCRRNFGVSSGVPSTDAEWRKRVHPDDLARIDAESAERVRCREPFEVEYRFRLDTGGTRWLLTKGNADYDDAGRPVRLRGVNLDITERKRGEETLRLQERILDSMQEGVCLAAADGTIVFANPKFESMFHYEQGELIGKDASVLNAPSDTSPEARAREIVDTLRRDGVWEGDVHNITKDRQPFWCHATVSMVEHPEFGPVSIGVLQDITARRRAETALRLATEAAAAASAAKTQFLAHMSHEIRTPMNVVIGLAQLLERDKLTAEQMEIVHNIRVAGDSLLHIINDILDFSKIEAGQLRIERQPFALTPVLDRVDNLLRGTADNKGLQLAITRPTEHLGRFVGDPLRLEQVLVNLVGNAIKFTDRGGVALEVKPVATTDTSLRLRFEVRDTGIGIAPDALTQLFAPFTQADPGITRRFGGTGLGLAISKYLVEQMGGRIGAASHAGAGSTFWFEISLERAGDAAPVPAREGPLMGPILDGLRVLAADDNRMNLFVVGRMLTRAGASVATAADGQQVLQLLRAEPQGFDVVLMDVQMPVMDGLTATRAIRGDPLLAGIPVIALTAGVLAEEREAALAAGVDGFLAKPLDLKQLAEVLAPFVRRN